ncbi:MAG TPA: hypothetical protein VGM31_14215 [Puia sp.]|jgi:alpha-tubulin suppressor-like RCC1 family protein
MKKVLALALFAPIFFGTKAQTPDSVAIGLGEYVNFALNTTTHKGYVVNGNLTPIPGAPSNLYSVTGGCHHGFAIDSAFNAWGYADGSTGQLGNGSTSGNSSMTKVLTDSLGNAFTDIRQIVCGRNNYGGFWNTLFIKGDGTLWICGETEGGALGNGTWGSAHTTRPVQIHFPAGVQIKKVVEGYVIWALATNGDVYTWGGGNSFFQKCLAQGGSPNYLTPTKITLPAPASDIACGALWYYALVDGNVYATAQDNYSDYIGISPQGSLTNVAQNVMSFYGFSAGSVKSIYANDESSYCIKNDGTLWGWGGNAVGSVGNGDEIDYARYGGYPLPYGTTNPFPWNWDQGNHENQVQRPVQLMKGYLFKQVYTESALVYSCYAMGVDGRLYSWGRNKGGCLGNGVVEGNPTNGAIGSRYPNFADVPWPSQVNPQPSGTNYQTTCQYCLTHPTETSCAVYTIPANTKPVARVTATVTGNMVVLNGSTSTDNVHITYYLHTQLSGSSVNMGCQGCMIDTLKGVSTGTYTMQMRTIDNGWLSDSTTVTFSVGVTPPTVTPGGPYTITLPANSQVISVTAAGNDGATITGYAWTKTSGPGSTTITGNTTATATVSGLQQGAYVFHCVVTDSNTTTGSADVAVTVNPAPGGTIERNYLQVHRYRAKTVQ